MCSFSSCSSCLHISPSPPPLISLSLSLSLCLSHSPSLPLSLPLSLSLSFSLCFSHSSFIFRFSYSGSKLDGCIPSFNWQSGSVPIPVSALTAQQLHCNGCTEPSYVPPVHTHALLCVPLFEAKTLDDFCKVCHQCVVSHGVLTMFFFPPSLPPSFPLSPSPPHSRALICNSSLSQQHQHQRLRPQLPPASAGPYR